MSDFIKELEKLLNKHSRENTSNTPDFILAKYLRECLFNYGKAIYERDKWFDFKPFGETRKREPPDG